MPILDSFSKLEARPSAAGPVLSAFPPRTPPFCHAVPARYPTLGVLLPQGWRQGAALSQLQAVQSRVLLSSVLVTTCA